MPGMPSQRVGKCGLCGTEETRLCHSDLLPKAIARWVRKSAQTLGARNPQPVFLTERGAVQRNYRIAEYLLCPECEEKFNKNGETWVLKNAYRGAASFPLRSQFHGLKPIVELPIASVFDARQIAALDLDKLIYFACSVFWRASACRWTAVDHDYQLDTGPYRDLLRRYLLGESAFPTKTALIISVSGNTDPLVGATFPHSGRVLGTWQHRFSIPGLAFWMHNGYLPEPLRFFCAAASRVLCLAPNLDATFIRDGITLMTKSDPSRLRRIRAER
jgi:hypothetical protein